MTNFTPLKDNDKPISDKPLVSISCISYNQEKYIRNALEGFLNQEVDFPVEILIHDDASTDSTPDIIQGYENQYPHLIKPILNTENQFSKGVKCMHASFNFQRARGEFIATCEGDDYWLDPLKLKKQVSFLQKNEGYSMCSHDAYIGYWNESPNLKTALTILYRNLMADGFSALGKLYNRALTGNEYWLSRRLIAEKAGTIKLSDVLRMYHKSIFIPTVSIMGRCDFLRSMPEHIFDSPTGHKEHILWLALHGDIFHMPIPMAQKVNQKNSLTQTKIHKTMTASRHQDFASYLNTFLEVELPQSSRKELERLLKTNPKDND